MFLGASFVEILYFCFLDSQNKWKTNQKENKEMENKGMENLEKFSQGAEKTGNLHLSNVHFFILFSVSRAQEEKKVENFE